MSHEKFLKNIDLMIIDIDDSFIYHRTVAAANRIFLKTLCKLFRVRLKKGFFTTKSAFSEILRIFSRARHFNPEKKTIYRLFVLSCSALMLHLLNIVREIVNRFGCNLDNRLMIRIWAETIKALNIEYSEYMLSKRVLKRNIYKKMLRVCKAIKKSNPKICVAAISQSFSISGRKDPIKALLGIDFMITNIFYCRKGRINDYGIIVGGGRDKKRIAQDIIRKRRPRSIGLVIDDYEDLELLKLSNIKMVVYTPKIERFIDKNRYDIALRVDV